MPPSLRRLLEESGRVTMHNRIGRDGTLERVETVTNEIGGAVPAVARLCEQDPTVERAVFCHAAVRHVFKLQREGGFCGYRNIQMLISYVRGVEELISYVRGLEDSGRGGDRGGDRGGGGHHFDKGTPGVLALQDMIERAWDRGFNAVGRVETGGIRGTRKYIGTAEVSFLVSFGRIV